MVFVNQAVAIPLAPTDDAFVSSLNPTANYGSFTYLATRAVTTAQIPTYLKFDLSSYASFDSAVLWLYDYSSSGSTTLNVYTTTTNTWDETSIDYTNDPSRGTEFVAAGITGTGWVSWDITQFANNFAGDQLSLMLYSTGQIPTQLFYSKESSYTDLRPYLDVVETAPVPEPATMLLFGTGIAGLAAIRRKRKE